MGRGLLWNTQRGRGGTAAMAQEEEEEVVVAAEEVEEVSYTMQWWFNISGDLRLRRPTWPWLVCGIGHYCVTSQVCPWWL